MKKRGQAAAAATLIAIVAIIIIGYVLVVPPEERAKILGEDLEEGEGVSEEQRENETLLLESPGRIDYLSLQTIEHAIPSTHIYTKTEGAILAEKDSIYIKNGLFSSVIANFSFEVKDLVNTESILLSFKAPERKGRLIVLLNGRELFNRQVRTYNVDPIKIEKRYLKQNNIINVMASSPGLAFWKTNEYTLEDIKVTGDVTSTLTKSSKNTFLVSGTEYNNLNKVKVKFAADCNIQETGKLDVYINDYNIYSGVPDCGVSRVPIEVSPTYVREGENTLLFRIDRGEYFLYHVVVESELKAIDFPVYYFELSEEEYQDISGGDKSVKVKMTFVDEGEEKRGELVINGRTRHFETRELSYDLDISDYVVRASNAIKIRPRTTLEMRQLEVILADE